MLPKRSKKYSVGKTIGPNTWVHKQYEKVFPKQPLEAAKKHLPKNFPYTIVKYNSKTNAFSFISSLDFDTADEPLVGDSIKINPDGSIKKTSQAKNPLIYHHKWLMVDDDYQGFNVNSSITRSLEWKTLIGTNREISNKIGRQDYWLKEIVPQIIKEDLKRSSKTAMTRKDISKPTRVLLAKDCIKGSVLHHGCGKASEDSKKLKAVAISYAEYDPTFAPNKDALNKKYTTVVSNYVLNTLPKEARLSAWRDLARCTEEAAYVTIRQDKITGKSFKDGVLTTKGTFQIQLPKEEFVAEAKTFFDNVDVLHKNGMLMLKCS